MEAAIPAGGHAEQGNIDDDAKVRLGMRFYILTDVIFVVFLFVTYIWLRAYNTLGGWFPAGTKLPDSTTSNVLTILIVLSGVSYFVGYLGIRANNQLVLRIGSLVALLLLLVGLIGQIRFMGSFPFTTTSGSFASTFIMLSGYHVYHMLVAVFLGLGLTHRAFRGRYSRDRMLGVVTVGYFWYWMAAFPVLTWLLMLVLSPKV